MGKGGDARGEILGLKSSAAHDATVEHDLKAFAKAAAARAAKQPWPVRGGMHVNEVGMGLNVTVPPIFLACTAVAATATSLTGGVDLQGGDRLVQMLEGCIQGCTPVQIFAAVFVVQAVLAYAAHGMRTVFCVVAVPCYMTSLLVLPATLESRPVPTIALATAIAMWRVGVCMSVCLHRYAAHSAFKCGRTTQLLLNVLGCAAHQGGPIWWASQHRCHHKYCDLPRDPHSSIQDGVEQAFSFFGNGHAAVEEEFAPKHNDTWYLRVLDTWSFAVCTAEMFAAYHFFGREGLFISYTSMWICQTITLWFNVANHPPDSQPGKACQAANYKAKPTGWYPAFLLLDLLYPTFGWVVSEAEHEDHHKHASLAKRDQHDCAYYSFIKPLELLGLVWNVKKFSAE
ncbi:hypothetical protein ACHAXT_006660 [Thalassiosira profunda]